MTRTLYTLKTDFLVFWLYIRNSNWKMLLMII